MTSVTMLTKDIEEGIISLERCIAIDNVCHGREGHIYDSFYMYVCLFKDTHV